MHRQQLIDTLKELRPELAAEGVSHLAMFGSRARGDARPDSDIDLLVEVRPDTKFSLLNLVGVELIVGDRLGIAANAMMRRSLEPEFSKLIDPDVIEIF